MSARKGVHCWFLLVLVTTIQCTDRSKQLHSSQVETLLKIKGLLNYPSILSSWNNQTDFCNIDPSSSFTVVCYEDTITQLHIIGEDAAGPPQPENFSMDSYVTTLVKLSNLKVLRLVSLGLWGPLPGKIAHLSSLEILNVSSNFLHSSIPQELSSLKGLQTLVLDGNMFAGQLPDWLYLFQAMTVLSLRNNLFNGSLPESLSSLENLRVLSLSQNHFHGAVPDFGGLKNLQILELDNNAFGPEFPQLAKKLVILVLSKNKFRSGIPDEVSSYYQLQRLDISENTFMGPFPQSFLSLPSLTYLNISGNKFTGMLFENVSCNDEVQSVDLSSNLLTGNLPSCLVSDSSVRIVSYGGNCLAEQGQKQHSLSFCCNEALAVGVVPQRKKKASESFITYGIVGTITGVISLVGLIVLIMRRVHSKRAVKNPPTRDISEKASTGYTSKFLSDARYVSQKMKLGALSLPPYRTFSLEEVAYATNDFNTECFMEESSHGQMYRGRMKDGSLVAIKCIKLKKGYSTQDFMPHLELFSKLRHRHLVCALGHCFECYLDDSSVSRMFLIFEYVAGTLQSWISVGHPRQPLTWAQRIAAAIGVAKGIEFLHTGIVPGTNSNNLKMTDVLLDQNLVAKICSYNLHSLSENLRKVGRGIYYGGSKYSNSKKSVKGEYKCDIYNIGEILLEIIIGKPLTSSNEVETLKKQFRACIITDDAARRSLVDPVVRKACLDESLKTMMEICVRCLNKEPSDRPSIEDVLWNLQYAAQVQDAWHGDSE